jgi:hydroxymethylglutaryl-CoA reductase (NADPH)
MFYIYIYIYILPFSEALPFLVIIIGFERHIKYTQAIICNNEDQHQEGEQYNSVIILLARDCFTEVIFFYFGAKSDIPGLREFCLLSAILLTYDFVLLFSWYTAVLAFKAGGILCSIVLLLAKP